MRIKTEGQVQRESSGATRRDVSGPETAVCIQRTQDRFHNAKLAVQIQGSGIQTHRFHRNRFPFCSDPLGEIVKSLELRTLPSFDSRELPVDALASFLLSVSPSTSSSVSVGGISIMLYVACRLCL